MIDDDLTLVTITRAIPNLRAGTVGTLRLWRTA
jgi:hypothetical protein